MATSNEKTIILILLVVIILFLVGNIVPVIFMSMRFPADTHFSRLPGFFHFAPLFPLLLLLTVWLVVVIWVYRDAERRTMNGILWALLVFFGNFVGLLIYLIVRSEELSKRITGDASEPCPGCGKTVSQNYAFCPHCGTRLKAVCPGCDKPVASDWKVCPYCGQKLAEAI